MKFVALCPPEWLSRSAVYQINPRTFSSEGTIAAVTAELPALRRPLHSDWRRAILGTAAGRRVGDP